MRAMILAAGLGERMRPLTDRTPKPLLQVAGRPLIDHLLEQLASAGFKQLVVNVSHLAEQITRYCGDGGRWGVRIAWSEEAQPLETAGGIRKALPLLGETPFLVVNGDIWIEGLSFASLAQQTPADGGAHLVFVDNPPQHTSGDFVLGADGAVRIRPQGESGLTYAGVGVYTPGFFRDLAPGKMALRPLLDAAIAAGRVSGQHFGGEWQDVGTPERLAQLDQRVRDRSG